MGWRSFKKSEMEPGADDLKAMEIEYNETLARYWSPDAENLPEEEIDKMLTRLEELSQEITRQGGSIPQDNSCYCEVTGSWCSGRLPHGKGTDCQHCTPGNQARIEEVIAS